MSTLSLALITITVIIAVMIATRPAPRRTRSADQAAGESEQSSDPLPSAMNLTGLELTPNLALDLTHRNQWDRHDLAVGIGRDDQAAEPALLLWPASAEPSALAA